MFDDFVFSCKRSLIDSGAGVGAGNVVEVGAAIATENIS